MTARCHYVVTFYKTVTDDRGWDHEICQDVIRLRARDESSALSRAKAEFCRSRGLHDWSQHVDRYQVEPR